MSHSISKKKLNSILFQARQESTLVDIALTQHENYINAWRSDSAALLHLNDESNWALTAKPRELQKITLNHIEKSIHDFQILNQTLNNYTADESYTSLKWSLKTNKMVEVLQGAKTILSNLNDFTHLMNGEYPSKYNILTDFPIWLGENILGTSKATYLTAAMIEMQLTLNPEVKTISELPLPVQDPNHHWVDESSLAHLVPLPNKLVTELGESFLEDFPYYFSDQQTPHGLVYLHSGYAFGGHRFESRYPDGKENGPEDCSSWMSKLLETDNPFSTSHLYGLYLDAKNDTHYFEHADPFVAELADKLIPIIDLPDEIAPGTVMAFRNINPKAAPLDLGHSGHTALVLGELEDGDLLVLSYGRSMPKQEGFGIEIFDPTETKTRKVLFFEEIISDVQPTLQIADNGTGVYYPPIIELPDMQQSVLV